MAKRPVSKCTNCNAYRGQPILRFKDNARMYWPLASVAKTKHQYPPREWQHYYETTVDIVVIGDNGTCARCAMKGERAA